MKQFLLTLTFLFVALGVFSQKDTYCGKKSVKINVDVLGPKHLTTRYYHPINGTYNLYPKRIESKTLLKGLNGFELIQPADYLTEVETEIQANSLRHFIDPKELIYINWAMGRDSINYVSIDSFKVKSEKIRTEKYQKLVKDYFEPFYISKYEITNREYREFVYWVRDSIIREALYHSEFISNGQAVSMLNIPKDILKEGIYDEANRGYRPVEEERQINREIYSFNWDYDYKKELKDAEYIPSISPLLHRSNERFYKRREFNTAKFIYRYYEIDMERMRKDMRDSSQKKGAIRGHEDRSKYVIDTAIPIYPDTTCWTSLTFMPFNTAMANMYFWHPAYDNYPVVGISYDQAKAFCHWKQQQLKKEHPEIAFHFKFDLPRIYEYEWAITASTENQFTQLIQDNELSTNLCLAEPDGRKVKHHESHVRAELGYTQKVFAPYGLNTKKYLKQRAKQKPPKKGMPNPHYAMLRATDNENNRLANGIEFLSNNISEWMDENYAENYSELIEAYINYNCFSNPEYCEHQRYIDQNLLRENDSTGQLIYGGNWYDERNGLVMGVNTSGLYPKVFKSGLKSFATVGFRCVLRRKR